MPAEPALHGADPGAEPARPGRHPRAPTPTTIQNANNTDSPWVDQSQTYTSHASHQVFLREYAEHRRGRRQPAAVSTGRLLGGARAGRPTPAPPTAPDGIGTWAAVKKQAARPARAAAARTRTSPTSRCWPPTRTASSSPVRHGLPQYVTKDRARSRATSPTRCPVPGERRALRHPVPDRHRAQRRPVAPGHRPQPGTPPVAPDPDGDSTPSADFASQPAGTYDDEMLNAHFACGDGRCNENIALTTIHQVFHSEHDRLVADIEQHAEPADNAALSTALPRHAAPTRADRRQPDVRLRRAAVPGRPLRHRDGVPAPGVRGVRPQGAAGGPAVPRLLAGHQPGDRGGVRARGLPVRALDARRRRGPHEHRADGTKRTTRCRCSRRS